MNKQIKSTGGFTLSTGGTKPSGKKERKKKERKRKPLTIKITLFIQHLYKIHLQSA